MKKLTAILLLSLSVIAMSPLAHAGCEQTSDAKEKKLPVANAADANTKDASKADSATVTGSSTSSDKK